MIVAWTGHQHLMELLGRVSEDEFFVMLRDDGPLRLNVGLTAFGKQFEHMLQLDRFECGIVELD